MDPDKEVSGAVDLTAQMREHVKQRTSGLHGLRVRQIGNKGCIVGSRRLILPLATGLIRRDGTGSQYDARGPCRGMPVRGSNRVRLKCAERRSKSMR